MCHNVSTYLAKAFTNAKALSSVSLTGAVTCTHVDKHKVVSGSKDRRVKVHDDFFL